jgi:ABC-type nitrate/sulfonate/bicarbonate transport system permease component
MLEMYLSLCCWGLIPCLTFPFLWLVVEDTKIENTQKVLPSPKALVRNIWDVLKSRSAYQTMGALFLYLVLQVRNTALNEMLEHDGISMYDINVATTMGSSAYSLESWYTESFG